MQWLGILSIDCRMIDTLIMVGVCAGGIYLLNYIMTDTDRHAEQDRKQKEAAKRAEEEKSIAWEKRQEEERRYCEVMAPDWDVD